MSVRGSTTENQGKFCVDWHRNKRWRELGSKNKGNREVAGKWRGEWNRRIEGSNERWEKRKTGGERKHERLGVVCDGKRLQVVLSGPKVHLGGRAGEQVSQACMCLSLTWISFVSAASQWPQVSAPPPPLNTHTPSQGRTNAPGPHSKYTEIHT